MQDYQGIIDAAKTSVKAKQLAAQLIPKFYKFFPDLSGPALDAHLDLVEAEELGVRIFPCSLYIMLFVIFYECVAKKWRPVQNGNKKAREVLSPLSSISYCYDTSLQVLPMVLKPNQGLNWQGFLGHGCVGSTG